MAQGENYSARSPAIPAGSRFGSCGRGDPQGCRATHHAQSLFPKKTFETLSKKTENVRQMSGVCWPRERTIAPGRLRSRLGVVLVVVGAGIRTGAEQLTMHNRYSQKRDQRDQKPRDSRFIRANQNLSQKNKNKNNPRLARMRKKGARQKRV